MAKMTREEIAKRLGEDADTTGYLIGKLVRRHYRPLTRKEMPATTRLIESAAASAGVEPEKLSKWLCDQLNE